MNEIWILVGLSILPGLGNFLGGMAAEFFTTSPRRLNLALHTASGIVIGVVAIELMPEALNNIASWWIAAAFAAGGAAYIGVEGLIGRMTSSRQSGSSGSMWMIYVAVGQFADCVRDGFRLIVTSRRDTMRQRDKQVPKSAEETVRDIRRATRRHFSAEEKIRIVLDGLRGEDSIAEL